MVSIEPLTSWRNTRLTMGGYLYSELRIVK